MKEIYYYTLDFKEIHPIRFWGIIIGVAIILTILRLIYIKLVKHQLPNNKGNINKAVITKIEIESAADEKLEKTKKLTIRDIITNSKLLVSIIFGLFIIILFLIGFFFFYEESTNNMGENPSISNSEYIFGIDISHHQGRIDWSEMRKSHHPIEFVFIRATMGEDGNDRYFKQNWENAKKYNYVRGAYHYYRPNENSTKQFENFKSVVKLEQGDFIPVLDIEKESKYGRKNLREGVLNWLKLAEKEYGVKPIIYTGLMFYQHILRGHVDEYPLWIAAYSGKDRLNNVEWTFHQFTENVKVKGIRATVDGNDFKGELKDLDNFLIKIDTKE